MAFEIQFHEDAEIELNEAIQWYENQTFRLGGRFHSTVAEAIENISHNPTHYTFCFGEYRDFHLKSFPYRIIFRLKENVIVIIAIFHTSRNETDLQQRI